MLEKLIDLIKDKTNANVNEINENSVLLSDLGMNSLELVQLVCDVEDEFEVEIPDRVIKTFKTVGDVMNFLKINEV
jgi:acyl carrier protein